MSEMDREDIINLLKELTDKGLRIEITSYKRNDKRMDIEQALGYMLLACHDTNLSPEKVYLLHSSMLSKFEQYSSDEAKEFGNKWFQAIKNNQEEFKNKEVKSQKTRRRSIDIKLPEIPESNATRRLRAQNRQVLLRLDRLKNGPIGLFRLLRDG
jgi:hypothetical protein